MMLRVKILVSAASFIAYFHPFSLFINAKEHNHGSLEGFPFMHHFGRPHTPAYGHEHGGGGGTRDNFGESIAYEYKSRSVNGKHDRPNVYVRYENSDGIKDSFRRDIENDGDLPRMLADFESRIATNQDYGTQSPGWGGGGVRRQQPRHRLPRAHASGRVHNNYPHHEPYMPWMQWMGPMGPLPFPPYFHGMGMMGQAPFFGHFMRGSPWGQGVYSGPYNGPHMANDRSRYGMRHRFGPYAERMQMHHAGGNHGYRGSRDSPDNEDSEGEKLTSEKPRSTVSI